MALSRLSTADDLYVGDAFVLIACPAATDPHLLGNLHYLQKIWAAYEADDNPSFRHPYAYYQVFCRDEPPFRLSADARIMILQFNWNQSHDLQQGLRDLERLLEICQAACNPWPSWFKPDELPLWLKGLSYQQQTCQDPGELGNG